MDADELIREYVDRHERSCLDEMSKPGRSQKVYDECLDRMFGMPFDSITRADVNRTVRPYLVKWGNMGRVVNNRKNVLPEWPDAVADIIRSNSVTFSEFRRMNLGEHDLNDHEQDIKRVYSALARALKPVAAAKTLHLLCPNFFPLWDNAVSDGVRNESRDKSRYIPYEKLSATDYFRFMLATQEFLLKHNETIAALNQKYGRGKLKIIDECFTGAVRNPFCMLFDSGNTAERRLVGAY